MGPLAGLRVVELAHIMAVGEHTREVLAELGYSMREIDDFASSGTVVEQSMISCPAVPSSNKRILNTEC